MHWEAAIWWLYTQVETQWRMGFDGKDSLDYGPAIAIIKELRWSVVSTLGYLKVIELTAKECWREQRESSPG